MHSLPPHNAYFIIADLGYPVWQLKNKYQKILKTIYQNDEKRYHMNVKIFVSERGYYGKTGKGNCLGTGRAGFSG